MLALAPRLQPSSDNKLWCGQDAVSPHPRLCPPTPTLSPCRGRYGSTLMLLLLLHPLHPAPSAQVRPRRWRCDVKFEKKKNKSRSTDHTVICHNNKVAQTCKQPPRSRCLLLWYKRTLCSELMWQVPTDWQSKKVKGHIFPKSRRHLFLWKASSSFHLHPHISSMSLSHLPHRPPQTRQTASDWGLRRHHHTSRPKTQEGNQRSDAQL